jgi:hypothetical protein
VTTRRNPYCVPLDPTNPDHFADLLALLGATEAWAMRVSFLQTCLTANPHNRNLQHQLATAKHAQRWATNI